MFFFFFFMSFYSFFFLIFFFSFFLSCFLMFLGFIWYKGISSSLHMFGTLMKYECSYSEFDSGYYYYTMQFFLIALSFMLFDMEIILVLPYMYINSFSVGSLFFISIFFGFLILSLLYEMNSNSFKW